MFWKKKKKETAIEKLEKLISYLNTKSTDWIRDKKILDSLLEFEYAYIADMDTHEIIWQSEKLENSFPGATGKICYKTYQGFDKPCPFCTNQIIKKQPLVPYKWIYRNPLMNKIFLLTDVYIPIKNGKKINLRFELAENITPFINDIEREVKKNGK